MRFALAIPTDAESWRVVRRAEELGFSRAWFYDAQMLSADPFVAMAAAAVKTTRIRLVHDPSICVTPQYLAEELLRADGFSEVQYVEATDGFGTRLIAAGGAPRHPRHPTHTLRVPTEVDAGQLTVASSPTARIAATSPGSPPEPNELDNAHGPNRNPEREENVPRS